MNGATGYICFFLLNLFYSSPDRVRRRPREYKANKNKI